MPGGDSVPAPATAPAPAASPCSRSRSCPAPAPAATDGDGFNEVARHPLQRHHIHQSTTQVLVVDNINSIMTLLGCAVNSIASDPPDPDHAVQLNNKIDRIYSG